MRPSRASWRRIQTWTHSHYPAQLEEAPPLSAALTMPFTVGKLLEIEHLGLTLEAGASGVERALSWAHVCELQDPRPWLEGGEFIMTTGIAVPRTAQAQVTYVGRLSEAGVAGLGVAQGMSAPPLNPAMRQCADEVDLPIVRVSYEVPFIAISRNRSCFWLSITRPRRLSASSTGTCATAASSCCEADRLAERRPLSPPNPILTRLRTRCSRPTRAGARS